MKNEKEQNDLIDTGFVDVLTPKERKKMERRNRERKRRAEDDEVIKEDVTPKAAKKLPQTPINEEKQQYTRELGNTDEINQAIEEAATNDELIEKKKHKSNLICLTGILLILAILYYVGISLCTEYNEDILLIVNSAFLVFMTLILVISSIYSRVSRFLAIFNIFVVIGLIVANIIFILN